MVPFHLFIVRFKITGGRGRERRKELFLSTLLLGDLKLQEEEEEKEGRNCSFPPFY